MFVCCLSSDRKIRPCCAYVKISGGHRTQVSLCLNFRGTFTNSGGHTKSFKFLPVKLNSSPENCGHFLFKVELDVDSFGLRRGVDDNEVVSAIALVLN